MKRTCPFMGLEKDRDTSVSFPSAGNCCYRGGGPVRILLEYQERFCLTEEYVNCPVYRTAGKEKLSRHNREPDMRRNWLIQKYAALLVLLMVLTFAGWLVYQYRAVIREYITALNSPGQVSSTYVAPTFLASDSRAEAYQPLTLGTPVVVINTSVPTASAEVSPAASETTDSAENGRGLLIHLVKAGESLDRLAEEYYTTGEAILDINFNMKPPLMEGKVIVIPEGIVHTQKYPQFEVKSINDRTKVAFIVEKYGCDPALFHQYNRSLIVTQAEVEYILAKQKVLIPRERPKQ